MDLSATKHRILTRIDLSELIGKDLKLSSRSARQVACCPFHDEKTPSFTIYDTHYYCFGCKANGDAIDYIRKTKSLGFIDALKFLAEAFNIEAPELFQKYRTSDSLKEQHSLLGMMRHAQSFYVSNLNSSTGQQAKEYLLNRGFTVENIATYGFGMAPDSFNAMRDHITRIGFSEQQLVDGSLASKSQRNSSVYDFMRNRLTIPICDISGQVIGFGGRTLSGESAKYINSRESKLYDKSQIVFGLNIAKTFMRKKCRAIVTEGYMDTLQLWNQGFEETVACLGTALTIPQLRQIGNATNRVFLVFDGDQAGYLASLRSVSVALEVSNIEVKVCTLPKGHDPDSYIREFGSEKFEDLLRKSLPLLDFAIKEKLGSAHGLQIPTLISDEFIPWLTKIQDPMQRAYLIRRISDLSGIPTSSIESLLLKSGRLPRVTQSAAPESRLESKNDEISFQLTPLEFEFIGFILSNQLQSQELKQIAIILEHAHWPECLNQLLEDSIVFHSESTSEAREPINSQEFLATCSLAPQAIGQLLEKIKTKKDAFLTDSAAPKMTKIVLEFQKQKHLELRSRLKSSLRTASGEEQLNILREIADINTLLNDLA
jgi:DNA primase